MLINALKLKISTARGDFGFFIPFSRGLTIIRGGNSSGKSTIFLSLLYGLGMEEIGGGKNEMVLPYAVKDHFVYEGQQINIIASEIFVEVENGIGEALTFKRAIKDTGRSPKLIEIFKGRHLTQNIDDASLTAIPTYLHDPGGAQKEVGFHKYLENFLGYSLPMVPTTSGGETKLYLQAIFAALAVEQKRGWTDYIANIPFFGIRDARTRVVEFLLSLDVFESNAKRNALNAESVLIAADWDVLFQNLKLSLEAVGAISENVPDRVSALFDKSKVQIKKRMGRDSVPFPAFIQSLQEDYVALEKKAGTYRETDVPGAQSELDLVSRELRRLTGLYESTSATLSYQRAAVTEYEELFNEAKEDLNRNKVTLKLRNLGASGYAPDIANNRCPTCHQPTEDSLLIESQSGPQMDLETNIAYLEKQSRMLNRQIGGSQRAILDNEGLLKSLSEEIDNHRIKLNALRSDVATGAVESRAIVREQIQIEIEVERLQKLEIDVSLMIQKFESIRLRLIENKAQRQALPKEYYSAEDLRKIRVFETFFRANASAFGYASAPIEEVKINDENLVPYLSNIELREISADIKADSSASDFVRLIWSYLLALYQSSSLIGGGDRHPKILMLDEPGQHSMAETAQRALLQQLTSCYRLQSIVAASFDESAAVFKEVTQGVEFSLIELGDKSIKPLI